MDAVSNNGSHGQETSGRTAAEGEIRRTPWPLVVVALLLVVGPFLAWYFTWFGRALTDEQIEGYMREGKPRQIQHALSQIEERIEKGDESVARLFPKVSALSQHPAADVRMTAAWVMGVEHRSEDFHAALVRMLDDPEPIVRRNVALALVRFGDPRCRAELLAMLRPFTLKARTEGTALTALTSGTSVKRESLLLKYTIKTHGDSEVRSPLPGIVDKAFVKDGESFRADSDLFVITPDAQQVSDALAGLYYFGSAEDLAEVERYAGGVAGMSSDLKAKAAQTAEAIKRRIAKDR